MKALLVLCLAFFFYSSSSLIAQIPNAGFENWTNGDPDNWLTDNSAPTYTPITQTSDAHSGSSAVQGTVVDFSGIAIPPYLISGTEGGGFPFTTRPASIHGLKAGEREWFCSPCKSTPTIAATSSSVGRTHS